MNKKTKLNKHTRENVLKFKNGIDVADLLDFYNSAKFNGGKPVYHGKSIIGGKIPENAGVIILAVPKSVRKFLSSFGYEEKPHEIGVATDALITLAGIDVLGTMTEDEFLKAATRKTLGEQPEDSYAAGLVQEYLKIFPSLLMTKTGKTLKVAPFRKDYTPLRSYAPDREILQEYKVAGVVPAPLFRPDGNLEERTLTLNLGHQINFGPQGRDISQISRASPDKVARLYAQFLR